MLKVGITGGIGSGKTTVSRVFEILGVPVFYADEEAKKIMLHDAAAEIKNIFGAGVFSGNLPDRKKIAAVVFNDPAQLSRLNKLIHPRVAERFAEWCKENSGAPYVIKEAAILFESGAYSELDKVIAVYAGEELRIQRVIQRDRCSREEAAARMKTQMNEEEKAARADYVIYNDGNDLVVPALLDLHKKLLALS